MGDRSRSSDPLAGFTDTAVLARGSSATVHRARDEATGQLVAVKVYDAPAGTGADRAAFERETRALGALSRHPNVVTLHRAELTTGGRAVLVLELCERSLADELAADGPLPLQRGLEVGIALSGALETAHRAGVAHGAITPAEVLVTRYGEVALTDFGSTALRHLRTGTDREPTELADTATFRHAAPELLEGGAPGVESDVYGLASTLHELLTGAAPVRVTDTDGGPRREPAIAPSAGRDGRALPPALVDLLHRALARDPAARPRTPLEVAQELREIERTSGFDPTACRVAGADGSWLTPLSPGAVVSRRGRAAATTGLPPLDLAARARDAGRWRPPASPVATADLPPPPADAARADLPPPISAPEPGRGGDAPSHPA